MSLLRQIWLFTVNFALATTWGVFLSRSLRWYAITGELFLLLFAASEGIIVFFALTREHPQTTSRRIVEWAAALIGTFAPLLLIPSPTAIWLLGGRVLLAAGAALLIAALISLNFSLGLVPAHRGIKTDGLYRIVRHPMYLSYTVILSGYLLASFSWWNAVLAIVALLANLVRIRFEERHLAADPAYTAYRERVRWKLIPLVY